MGGSKNGSDKQKKRTASIRAAKCHKCKAQAVAWFRKKYWCRGCLNRPEVPSDLENPCRRYVSGLGLF